jgi:hypothetical protein
MFLLIQNKGLGSPKMLFILRGSIFLELGYAGFKKILRMLDVMTCGRLFSSFNFPKVKNFWKVIS